MGGKNQSFSLGEIFLPYWGNTLLTIPFYAIYIKKFFYSYGTHSSLTCDLHFPFQWFFSQPLVVLLYVCTNQHSAEHSRGMLWWPPKCSFCVTLSSLVYCPTYFSWNCLLEFPTLLPFSVTTELCLGSPSYTVVLGTSLFSLLSGFNLMLFIAQCLKPVLNILWPFFCFILGFGYLRQENEPSSCYYTMGRSHRSPLSMNSLQLH